MRLQYGTDPRGLVQEAPLRLESLVLPYIGRMQGVGRDSAPHFSMPKIVPTRAKKDPPIAKGAMGANCLKMRKKWGDRVVGY